MTAPMTSREELLKNHTMPNLPCPVCGTLCRADVILRHKQAISDNAQSAGQPLAWHCCDERYPFIRDIVTTNEVTIEAWRESGIKFQPLYALPSTGLPAPAPHAEVREALAHIDKRLVDLREANEIFKKASWDRSSDILRNDREIRWLIDFSTMLRLPSPQQDRGSALDTASFYGAECPSYPNCSGGCGLGCTHEIVGRGK